MHYEGRIWVSFLGFSILLIPNLRPTTFSISNSILWTLACWTYLSTMRYMKCMHLWFLNISKHIHWTSWYVICEPSFLYFKSYKNVGYCCHTLGIWKPNYSLNAKNNNIDTYSKLVCKNGFSHLRLALIINVWITLGLSSLDLVALYHIHSKNER
jgi:hypothetical protein